VRRALVSLPTPHGRRWSSFDDPVAVHVAHRHDRAPLAVAGVFAGPRPVAGPRPGRPRTGPWRASWDEAGHARAVQAVRAHIAAGEVYQANLTFRVRARFSGDPEHLFAALVRGQGPAHAVFVDLGDRAICSASPELLLARRGDEVRTRPMKGTARRGGDDGAEVATLRSSAKERAENTMIVDVARNDLGRVARVGSVRVERLHAVEHYPTVHQLTSSVRADTDADLVEVLGAVFPAASITGAPKVRATQVIAELEDSPRGVYCGTVGVLAPGRRWELNVAIRTAWVDRALDLVEYGVGGGIVWDSVPASEWAEARAKAAVLDGDGPGYELLETLRWEDGAGLLGRRRHRDRLLRSAGLLGFDLDAAGADAALDAAETEARAAACSAGRATDRPRSAVRVRLLVAGSGRARVETAPAPPAGTRAVPAATWRAALAPEPVRADDVFLAAKTTHRVVYEQARAAVAGADEVVLWNEEGRLTETTVGNLVLLLDGRLVTPRLGAGLLAGTARAALLEAGEVVEDELTAADLRRADGVWAVNALRGWVRLEPVDQGWPGGEGASSPGTSSRQCSWT
jgi:para-aminobenzoate synthetase / 4-amino-4-deoxychorismate lyase